LSTHSPSSIHSPSKYEDKKVERQTILLRIPEHQVLSSESSLDKNKAKETHEGTALSNWRLVYDEYISDIFRWIQQSRRMTDNGYFRATFVVREQIHMVGGELAEVVFSRATALKLGLLP
jgi:hypothetical protein